VTVFSNTSMPGKEMQTKVADITDA